MITKTYAFEKNGETYEVYTLRNASGCEMDILTYGARITRISVPDKNGNYDDVIVGFARPEEYCDSKIYHGATISGGAHEKCPGAVQLRGPDHRRCGTCAAVNGRKNRTSQV